MTDEKKTAFRVAELAAAIDLTNARICQKIWSGEIRATKFGRDWLIPASEYRRLVKHFEKHGRSQFGRPRGS